MKGQTVLEVSMTLRGFSTDPDGLRQMMPGSDLTICRQGERINEVSRAVYRRSAIISIEKATDLLEVNELIAKAAQNLGGWELLEWINKTFNVEFCDVDVLIRHSDFLDEDIKCNVSAETMVRLAGVSASLGIVVSRSAA